MAPITPEVPRKRITPLSLSYVALIRFSQGRPFVLMVRNSKDRRTHELRERWSLPEARIKPGRTAINAAESAVSKTLFELHDPEHLVTTYTHEMGEEPIERHFWTSMVANSQQRPRLMGGDYSDFKWQPLETLPNMKNLLPAVGDVSLRIKERYERHLDHMGRAVELASKSISPPGKSKPFYVGAKLVSSDGSVAFEAHKGMPTRLAGLPSDTSAFHAEELLLQRLKLYEENLALHSQPLPISWTLYTSIGPCTERGEPGHASCTEQIINAKDRVKKVVVATADPNPTVIEGDVSSHALRDALSRKGSKAKLASSIRRLGLNKLRRAGIEVVLFPESHPLAKTALGFVQPHAERAVERFIRNNKLNRPSRKRPL